MKNILIYFFILIFTLFGCSSVKNLKAGDGGTIIKISGKDYDQIWGAAISTVSKSLVIIESNKDAGVLKAEKEVGISNAGQYVGIFINKIKNEPQEYAVEVKSVERSRVYIRGQNWEKTIIEGIKAELKL